jgi:hypothetical protein
MPLENNAEAIATFASEQARRIWDSTQQPYLLSNLSPDLVREGINYRDVLGEQKLGDFIRSTDLIKVVLHPTQKSKIGLIPPDKDFVFEVEASPVEHRTERSIGSRRRYIISNFLQLVSELDDADAEMVQIPTHILTKLMRDK